MHILLPKFYPSYFVLIAGLLFSSLVCEAATPMTIARVSGNQQTGIVGENTPTPFVAVVKSATGAVVSGVQIDWTINSGGGSFHTVSTFTNSSGQASNTLTLGTVSGYDQAAATIHNTRTLALFGATASPGPATAIQTYSGNQQTGTVGSPLPNVLEAVCKDQYGNNASHTEVDWAVTGGGGSIPYSYSLTGGGIATKALTLGARPGQNYATATIHGTSKSSTFTADGVAGPVAALAIQSGNYQTGSTHGPLPAPFTVVAIDAQGNPKSGAQIVWTPANAGDTFLAGSSSTSSSGLASSTLNLGSSVLLHSATASVQGTNISQTFTATLWVNGMVTVADTSNQNPHALEPYFLGLSYMKDWMSEPLFNADNLPLVELYQKLGPGVLRVNAERPLNPLIWNHNGPGGQYGTISKADIARLAGFLKAANWKILYGIAFVGNNAACASGKTNCAADEAAVAVEEFGSNLLGFEIGNEPDVYSEPVYGDPAVPQVPGYTWADFISTTPVYSDGQLLPSWPAFASAIQAASPNAPLTGPATGIDWVIPFGQSAQASRIGLLSRHIYHATYNSNTPTLADLFTPDPRIPVQFPEMAAAAANISGGYRISECNSFSSYIPGVTDSFGAALWTIDFLFANAVYQSSGVNFHGGEDNPASYSPILDNGTNVVGIGPDYYGMFAYSMLAKGGRLQTTTVIPAPSTFAAYAVEETDGSTDIILTNKDPLNNFTVGISRPSATSEATSILMTAPSLSATTGFTLGGNAIGIDGSWAAKTTKVWPIVDGSATVTVPAASAQIVHLQ